MKARKRRLQNCVLKIFYTVFYNSQNFKGSYFKNKPFLNGHFFSPPFWHPYSHTHTHTHIHKSALELTQANQILHILVSVCQEVKASFHRFFIEMTGDVCLQFHSLLCTCIALCQIFRWTWCLWTCWVWSSAVPYTLVFEVVECRPFLWLLRWAPLGLVRRHFVPFHLTQIALWPR